ncbi:MAG: methyl-accepting chemotaxis protein [Planctomycetes bacterium]|nr:methyl-accepting chemotaxis protein [Planctomycetota bacterium]
MIGIAVPRLELGFLSAALLTASSYLVIGLGAAWTISRLIGRRMRDLAAAARVISAGDLTHRVETSGNDEVAELARAFSAMTESLLRIVAEVQRTADRIRESAEVLSEGSRELDNATSGIASAAENIAGGAELQVTRVTQTMGMAREFSKVATEVAQKTRELHESAALATVRATGGADDARRAARSIGRLTRSNATASEAVEGFRSRAGKIGQLSDSITTISNQTHLLAINAAVEAVRAGEDGRGFGVVAEEVSRLAEDVRRFAEGISNLNQEVMQGSRTAADQIQHSVQAADDVGEMVERTLSSFEGILEATRGTADGSGEIFELTDAQRTSAAQARDALAEISMIAERNNEETSETSSATREQTTSTREMARSAEELAGASKMLNELVSVFRH